MLGNACVLYSGGKDSSLMAVILKKLGYTVELVTANFGVYPSFIPARKTASALGFKHRVLDMDRKYLIKACDIIINDEFPNNGIKYLHQKVVDVAADHYDLVSDGTRRDDRTPKLDINQIRSLEDRKKVQYVNLDSFGIKTIKDITSDLFEFSHEMSNKDNNSDFEVEIRTFIDKSGEKSTGIFPIHYQTRVTGYKKNRVII